MLKTKIVLKPTYFEPVKGSILHSSTFSNESSSYVSIGIVGQSIQYESNSSSFDSSCQNDSLDNNDGDEANDGDENNDDRRYSSYNYDDHSSNDSAPISLSLIPPSWVNNFRDVYDESRHFAKYWFWDNFDWKKQSIWIGKFNQTNNLPDNNQQINNFLLRLVDDLNRYPLIKSEIYIKFYFSRNIKTTQPEINYLLICNGPHLPEKFLGTLVDITFEKYQLTESIVNKDKDFKRLLNHYLNWSNFYIYYNLMEELQY